MITSVRLTETCTPEDSPISCSIRRASLSIASMTHRKPKTDGLCVFMLLWASAHVIAHRRTLPFWGQYDCHVAKSPNYSHRTHNGNQRGYKTNTKHSRERSQKKASPQAAVTIKPNQLQSQRLTKEQPTNDQTTTTTNLHSPRYSAPFAPYTTARKQAHTHAIPPP